MLSAGHWWLEVLLVRTVAGQRHVEVDAVPHILLHVLHPHERLHAAQQAHTRLLSIEAQQEPDGALVLPALQHVEDVRNFCCGAWQSYHEGCIKASVEINVDF